MLPKRTFGSIRPLGPSGRGPRGWWRWFAIVRRCMERRGTLQRPYSRYRTDDGAPGFNAGGSAGPGRAGFRFGPNRMTELEALQRRILDDKPLLQRNGVTVTSVSIANEVLEIAIAERDPAAAAHLQQRYGSRLLRVRLGVTYRPLEGQGLACPQRAHRDTSEQ